MRTHPSPARWSTPLHRRIRRPHFLTTSPFSFLNPALLSLCASPLRRSHTHTHTHIHIERFSRRHRRRHVGCGFVALARTQLPRTTHLTQPSPSYFVAIEAWACQWTVYVWWPAAGLGNMTQRGLQCWTSRFAKTGECWVCATWLWKGSELLFPKRTLAPLHLKL